MNHEVDIKVGFVYGYTSGRRLFGEGGHWEGEEYLEEWDVIESIKTIVCVPQPPKVSVVVIWRVEEIALSFN